jgi:hypothetical protein
MKRVHLKKHHPDLLCKIEPLLMQFVHDLELATDIYLQNINLARNGL